VNTEHNVGSAQYQIFIATLQLRPSKIGGSQTLLLQHGAHRAIQNQDAFTEQFAKGQAPLDKVRHKLNNFT
jgi:hypothetical protein